ncbi:MAG: LysM peptidoglycan-binding domain-containing protein [Eubacteriales bacterium]|nr:LysM peptidoglycan-binding domain-containing protein [Eubacteriales bacterium]
MKKIRKIVLLTVLICALSTSLSYAAGGTYTVKSGDTLYKIAQNYDVTLNEILAANPSITNPSKIYVGQTITIPATKLVSYTVQKGDTMWGIANKFEISLTELKKANPGISDPSKIYVGQTVLIPDTSSLASHEQQVLELVNKERVSRGLSPLTLSTELSRVARIKSQDMIDNKYFSHISPTYGSPFDMMQSFGLRFSAAGENIAYGQKTAAEVMNVWMNSSGHRANILSEAYTHIGIGVAKMYNGTLYWTQMFMNPY